MAISLGISRRLSAAQTPSPTSMPTVAIQHTPIDIYPLRRAAEQCYETWRWCPDPVDSPAERRLWAQVVAADALLQVAVMDEQERLGAAVDSAKCGADRKELLRRIGFGGEGAGAS